MSPIWGCMKGIAFLSVSPRFCGGLEDNFAWEKRMMWKWLGALLLFPVQMVYLVVKAAVCLVLPPKLRDLSRENVLVTGGGRGIGRHLAREFARRGVRKVSGEGREHPPAALPRAPCPRLWVGWVGSLEKGERGSHFAELSHYINYISEVAHSSFPASCLSPSHP